MSLLFTLLFGISFANKPEYQQYDYMRREYPASNSNDSLGICYGKRTRWIQNPYVVALRYPSGSSCCSGSIVSLDPPIILTASHCLPCGTGHVRIGCDDPLICNGDLYFIDEFVQNSDYQIPLQFSNDIAIVRLTDPITTNGAQTVVIPSTETSDGHRVRVVGYGRTQNENAPRSLQEGDMNILNRAICGDIMNALLSSDPHIDTSMTCILDETGPLKSKTSTCSGDSGGPSGIRQGGQRIVQYGVTSWGLIPGCSGCPCCNTLPSVAANVPQFASWINGYIEAWTKGNFNYTHHGDKHYFYNH